MAKKVTTISIDEDILRIAKKELSNLSIFVEDCLKAYLGFNNTNVKSIDENLQTIQQCLLNIQIASTIDKETTIVETYNNEEQQKCWSKLFGKWRNNEFIEQSEYENASKILNTTVNNLKELFENIEFNCRKNDLIKCNDWGYAKTLI